MQGTTSLRGGQSLLANHPRTIGGIGYLFFVQGLGLLNQRVNFVRCEFAFVLGHVALAVGDDVAQLVFGCGRDFCRNERRPAQAAPLGAFPVTLCAVVSVNRIRGQARIRWLGLANGCSEHEEERTHGDCELGCFHVEPRRDGLVRVWMRTSGPRSKCTRIARKKCAL